MSDSEREQMNCYEVVTKAVETREVVATNAFQAKQKARSVVAHRNAAADVAAVKAEEIAAEECNLGGEEDR